MKCRCGERASFWLKPYRIALCEDCYPQFYVNLVKKSIKRFNILKKSEKILACVSGGKDSISMVYALKELGYDLKAFFIDLGVKKYSKKAKSVFEEISGLLNLDSEVVSLEDYGLRIDDLTLKKICSACGTSKRHLINRFARENGFDVIATGHTCDDIVVFFFKNMLSGNLEYIPKLKPRLEGFDGLITRTKPIFERTEKENQILVEILNFPYLKESCPHKPDDKWKEFIQKMEDEKPGFEQTFLRGLLKLIDRLNSKIEVDSSSLKRCRLCGEISNKEICYFCRLVEKYGKISNSKVLRKE
ncbi:MAG: adenine nucleotide alpha hydrolase family protein [Archaeoglobus sp.]|nr:adenine nucleotide alpha hydrolase family protein [Archaeoglobus sp.]